MPNPPASGRAAHLLCQEIPPPTMAKASLSQRDGREAYGKVLRRASTIANLNRRETADALEVDEGQLGRWWSGLENPQVFRYHAHPVLGAALIIAESEAHARASVVTRIDVRLTA